MRNSVPGFFCYRPDIIAFVVASVVLLISSATASVWAAEPTTAKAEAASEPLKLDMTIFFDGRSIKGPKAAKYQERWLKLCEQMKGYFENKHQTFGNGPFQSVACVPTIGPLANAMKMKPATWMMQVSDTKEKSGFEIFYAGAAGTPRLEASHVTLPNAKFVVTFSKTALIKDMAILLQDQLPMYSIFKMPADGIILSANNPLLPDPVPREFMVYTLNFDKVKQGWATKIVGYAIRNDDSAENGQLWDVRIHHGAVKTGETVFIHNIEGPGVIAADYSKRFNTLLGKLGIITFYDALMGALNSNIVGVRYGYPLLSAKSVLGKSAMFSMFLEVRGGFLRGLRLYFDAAPTAQFTTKQKNKETFGWNSANIGWSLGLPVPKFLSSVIQRVDVYPKIGMFNLTSKLQVIDANNTAQMAKFNMRNALNVGFETGVEHSNIHFGLFRTWVSYNKTWSNGSNTKEQFSTLNGGLDYYVNIYKMGQTRIKGLVFASGSYVSLGQTMTKQSLATTDTNSDIVAIEGMSYWLTFAGLGVTMAW